MSVENHTVTTILFARFDTTEKKLKYLFANNKWQLYDTDVVVQEEFQVEISVKALDQSEYTRLAINTLRDKQAKAWADAQQSVNSLEEKIKELQLLTWQSDVLKDGDFQVKYEEPIILSGGFEKHTTAAEGNLQNLKRGVLDDFLVPDGEAVLIDIVDGEIVSEVPLSVLQQTELDLAAGEWEAYPEGAGRGYDATKLPEDTVVVDGISGMSFGDVADSADDYKDA
jgi:hypothetical protein